jgi:hypothetical protein
MMFIPGVSYGLTYYVDYNSGSNSNNGSISYPWKECPGTQNPIGSTTSGWKIIAAGDTIVFTSGQTWNRPINISSTWYANPTDEASRITLTTSTESVVSRAKINVTGYTAVPYVINFGRNYITVKYFELTGVSRPNEGYGVRVSGVNYIKLLYSYVHDNYTTDGSPTGRNSYAVSGTNTDYGEYAYNVFENAGEKVVEFYTGVDNNRFHHNVFRQKANAVCSIDHLFNITRNSTNNSVYNNIFETYKTPNTDPSYGFKLDGDSATSAYPDNNLFYNNIIIGLGAGIGLMDAGSTYGNKIIGNIVYGNNSSFGSGSYGIHGINLGFGGSQAKKNVIKNNLIYAVRIADGYSHGINMLASSVNVSGNIIQNNLILHPTAIPRYRVGSSGGQTMATVESTWNGTNSNVFSGNVVGTSAPGFSGGTHPVSNLPTGFGADWLPNNTGLSLGSGSVAINAGIDAGSPFNVDILGISRPQGSAWDIGAYKYTGTTTTPRIPVYPLQIQIN